MRCSIACGRSGPHEIRSVRAVPLWPICQSFRPAPCSPGCGGAAPTPTTTTTATDPPAAAPAVVVVTCESRRDLERFLDEQLETARSLDAPVVVVDNASTDGSPDLVRDRVAEHGQLELVEMGRNAGYAAAVNAGATRVPGRDLLLLNPDIRLDEPGPARELARVLDAHPKVGVAAPRLVGEDGQPQPTARRFPSAAALLGTLPRLGGLGPVRRGLERYHEPSAAR